MADTTLRLKATPAPPSGPLADNPRQLGDYRLVRAIGRGGMGIVYEAEQVSLQRRVALKVIAGPHRWDAPARARFEQEARSAARLHHTNIVPIFEVGMAEGECYYAMQYIVGISLDVVLAHLAGRPLEGHQTAALERFPIAAALTSAAHPEHFRLLARLALQVAGGLAHAHVRGVIHRDIKPANLLLDIDGVVWITDFGLAKHADDNLTQTGELFGTLRYMAPERFRGSGDARSDIYALGTTLYELATRRPAYPEVTGPGQVALLADDPPRPASLVRSIPRDLETIILKAMDKDPKRRYATAQDLADDLRRFLDDEPIRARPIGALARTARWARRRPVLATLSMAVLVLTATVILGALTAALKFRDLAAEKEGLRLDALTASAVAEQKARAAEELALLALGILDESDPLALSGRVFGGSGSDPAAQLKPVQILQRTLAKLEEAPEIGPKLRAKLLDKIGAIHLSLGQFERGGPLLKRALAMRRTEYGDASLEVAETWYHLGIFYLMQKSLEPAEHAYRQSLAIRELTLGPEHPLVSVTLMHLAVVNAFSDFGSEAATLLRRARANLLKHPGPDSRECCLAVALLTLVLLNEDAVDEAKTLLPEALRLLHKHEGNTSLGQAVSVFLRGRLASKIGFHDQATRQYREAIELVRKTLGEEHFLAIMCRHELGAHFHNNTKDLKAAEGEFAATQRLSEKSFGPHSSQTALARMYLARVLRDDGRLAEAEPHLLEASDVLRKRKHGSLGRCLHIYWEVQYKQGKVKESLPTLLEAVSERKKAGDVIWYSNAAANLASVYMELGMREEAVRELRASNQYLAQQQAPPADIYPVLARRSAWQYQLLRELAGRDMEANEAADSAIAALRKALETRKMTVRNLKNDADLNPLRELASFRQLLVDTQN